MNAKNYLGAKSNQATYKRIIALLCPHDTFIESHFGTGAITLKKAPAINTFGIDPNKEILNSFKETYPVSLLNETFDEFITAFNFDTAGKVLIYSDPPYVLSTRSKGNKYTFDYTDKDHIKLLRTLKGLSSKNIKNIISGYPSELYDNELENWHSLEYQAITRGGVRTEKLWFDYKPTNTHWLKYGGNNSVVRQQIKRKAERWKINYSNSSEAEKMAILHGLLEVDIKEGKI